jgi:hypothetical protein
MIQVTEAGEQAMQIRVLVSSADSSQAWDLRCKLREQLVDFIRANYPQSLPVLRAVVTGPAQG